MALKKREFTPESGSVDTYWVMRIFSWPDSEDRIRRATVSSKAQHILHGDWRHGVVYTITFVNLQTHLPTFIGYLL